MHRCRARSREHRLNKQVSFASASDTREQKPQLRELAPNVYGYISAVDSSAR